MPAVMHIDDRDLCLPCISVEGLDPEQGEAIPINQVPQVDPQVSKFQAKRQKLKEVTGPIESKSKENVMAKHICECGCGGELSDESAARGWRYVRGHKPAGVGNKPAAEKNASAKEKKTTARRIFGEAVKGRPSISEPPVADVRYTMAVSAQFLERAWERLTPELKAVAIAAALEQ